MGEISLASDRELFAALAADLLGAEVGPGRAGDLDRAVRAAARAAGQPMSAGALAVRLRVAPPGDPARRAFVESLAVAETQLFRLQGQFDALADAVLPALLADRQPVRRLRLWSAGCSSGEEAWSLAVLLERAVPPGWDATVLATDVDEGALERARLGVYGARSFRGVPPWVRSRWFSPAGPGRWEVVPALRRRVRFAALNLVTDDWPSSETGTGAVDVLLCRNVLMYLTPPARAAVAARLARSLAPGGWLAVAPAEVSVADFSALSVRQFPLAILHRRPDR